MRQRQIDLTVLDPPAPRTIDLSVLDEPDVSVKLDYAADQKELENQAFRELQTERYPTSEERGDLPGYPVRGAETLGSVFSLRGLGTQLGTVLNNLNPMNLRPSKLAQIPDMLGQARERSETQVGEAWQRGDYPFALTRGTLNMLPLGPLVGGVLESGGRDPNTLLGEIETGLIAPKVGKLAKNVITHPVRTVKAPLSAIRSLKMPAMDMINEARGITPDVSYAKGLRPMSSKLTFNKATKFSDSDAKVAMPLVKQAADKRNIKIEDVFTHNDAVEAAITDQIAKQKPLMGDRPIIASGRPIAKAIVDAVPDLDRLENPATFEAIKEWAYKTYDRDFTVQRLDKLRKDANSLRAGYHGKLPTAQMSIDRTLDAAIKKAKTDKIREVEYGALENFQGTGEGLRQVNSELKSLLNVADISDRRFNVELRSAVQNLPQQVSKFMALGQMGKAAKALITGSPGTAAMEALTGLGEIGLANFLKELNSTSGQLASAFRRLRDVPKSVPVNPVGRFRRALNAAGQGDVLPTTTGRTTAGNAYEGWTGPGAIPLKQGLRQGLEEFMETGSAAESLPSPAGGSFLDDVIDVPETGLVRQGGVPEVIGGETIVKARPLIRDLGSSGVRFNTPEAPLPAKALLPGQKRIVAGRPGIEMPEGEGLTLRDILRVTEAEPAVVRDPKTGRFKKIFTSGTKSTKGKK